MQKGAQFCRQLYPTVREQTRPALRKQQVDGEACALMSAPDEALGSQHCVHLSEAGENQLIIQ